MLNYTLGKEEAISLMMIRVKITHRLFFPEEWILMEGSKVIVNEEFHVQTADQFWKLHQGQDWETGYAIWAEPK